MPIAIDPKTTEGHETKILSVEGTDPLGKRFINVGWGPHILRITLQDSMPTDIDIVQPLVKGGQYVIENMDRLMLDLAAGRSNEGDGSFRGLIRAILEKAEAQKPDPDNAEKT